MNKPEKNFQDKAIRYLKDHKIYYINQYGNGWSAKGAPDLVVCLNGRFVAFELKVDKNHMQSDQVIHKMRIERSGGLHYTPYTLEEFIKTVEELSND